MQWMPLDGSHTSIQVGKIDARAPRRHPAFAKVRWGPPAFVRTVIARLGCLGGALAAISKIGCTRRCIVGHWSGGIGPQFAVISQWTVADLDRLQELDVADRRSDDPALGATGLLRHPCRLRRKLRRSAPPFRGASRLHGRRNREADYDFRTTPTWVA